MNNKRILCNWCNVSHDKIYIFKHKSGMNYCWYCRKLVNSGIMPHHIRPIDQEEFDKNLKLLLKAPPLKLKDLKEKLKKEREEKQNEKKKTENEKNSK